jgi:hypothetical protein
MADGIEWDVAALRHALATSPDLRDHLERLGDAGIAYAKSIAPDAPALQKGYIDSFVADVDRGAHGIPQLAIANTDFKAWWIEAGTAPHSTRAGGLPVATPAHHVLDRTLDHLRSTS